MAIIHISEEALKDVIKEVCEEIGLGEKIPGFVADAIVWKIQLQEDEQERHRGM